jgi:metal-responsive CopG/Arc/MetJ family transcriptional regulator
MHTIMRIINADNMTTKRLNITLPEEVMASLEPISNKSRFIAEAVREKIAREARQRLDILLCEGYRATASEDRRIAEEWDPITPEDWS